MSSTNPGTGASRRFGSWGMPRYWWWWPCNPWTQFQVAKGTSLNCCVKLTDLALLQFNVIGIDLYPIFHFSQTFNMSNCQNVIHVGLSSLTYGAKYLQHLFLAYSLSISPWNIYGNFLTKSLIYIPSNNSLNL